MSTHTDEHAMVSVLGLAVRATSNTGAGIFGFPADLPLGRTGWRRAIRGAMDAKKPAWLSLGGLSDRNYSDNGEILG